MRKTSMPLIAVFLALSFACSAFAAQRVVMLEEAYWSS